MTNEITELIASTWAGGIRLRGIANLDFALLDSAIMLKWMDGAILECPRCGLLHCDTCKRIMRGTGDADWDLKFGEKWF